MNARRPTTILLLGGTSETAPLAVQLAEAGFAIIVSKATDVPLDVGSHPRIAVRIGPLDERSLASLLVEHGVRAIVDAAHPYAATLHRIARGAAAAGGIPYFRFARPASVSGDATGVTLVCDHAAAAAAAFARGRPVLLTTGTRNLRPYADAARRTGTPLFVRALDHGDSIEACTRSGVPRERVVACRGPFSVESNREHIRRFGIGVLVTKDGGASGGVPEKLAAAQAEGCEVIVVARPEHGPETAYDDVQQLVAAVVSELAAGGTP
jgi:precorrin-6A/cobalt-precorrin-6A reductase